MSLTPIKIPAQQLRQLLHKRLSSIPCGFPSPADDYLEPGFDLLAHIVSHPAATFMAKAEGDSMEGCGIFSGDLLIVDRSETASNGSVVVVALNGELMCKQLDLPNKQLLSPKTKIKPIPIPEGSDCVIEGVVTFSLRDHKCLR